MERKLGIWSRVALLAPLASACAFNGCSANALRDTADALDEAAEEIDGDSNDVDLGDWLADELEDI